jgi:hypothetical protein
MLKIIGEVITQNVQLPEMHEIITNQTQAKKYPC